MSCPVLSYSTLPVFFPVIRPVPFHLNSRRPERHLFYLTISGALLASASVVFCLPSPPPPPPSSAMSAHPRFKHSCGR